jgi:cytochrome c-type biogenesis protein
MKYKLLILGIVILAVAASFIAIKSGAIELRKDSGIEALTLVIIIAAALVDSVNPCAFSVLLITIAFLFSIGKNRKKIVKIGTTYILGIFTIYVLIGLGILKVLYLFNTPHFIARIGASILIFAGAVTLINWMFPNFPIKLKMPQSSHKYLAKLMEKGSIVSALAMGVLVAMFEFPCTGGPYLFVLGLLHDKATYLQGLGLLIMYNLIFVLPLFVILAIASDKNLLEKAQQWKKYESKKMKLITGIVMVLLGIAIFVI